VLGEVAPTAHKGDQPTYHSPSLPAFPYGRPAPPVFPPMFLSLGLSSLTDKDMRPLGFQWRSLS